MAIPFDGSSNIRKRIEMAEMIVMGIKDCLITATDGMKAVTSKITTKHLHSNLDIKLNSYYTNPCIRIIM